MHSAATKFGGFSACKAIVGSQHSCSFKSERSSFFFAIKSLRSISANVAVISQMNPGPGVDTF